ncbi:hypothetical protein VTK56DRAFT_4506 [Thermocarpiscus australiensis]
MSSGKREPLAASAASGNPMPVDGEQSSSGGARRPAESGSQRLRMRHNLSTDLATDHAERPESPSDAIMIRRGAGGGRSSSGSPAKTGSQVATQTGNPSNQIPGSTSRDNSPSSIHQRAISAPEFPPNSNVTAGQSDAASTSRQAPAHPAAAEASSAPAASAANTLAAQAQIGPSDLSGYRFYLDPSLINSAVPRLYDTVDDLMREIDFTGPKTCKFMDDCDLSRPKPGETVNWRKAMSHIFGRNKNCTRSIPDNVWLCLCRKHYQRARYRNNNEYNKRLCGLVETQILRLEAWSNENRRSGTPENGIVVDWALVVRRREQLRLEEKKSKKRPRPRDEEDGDEEDDDDDANMPSLSNSAQVPDWLLAKCGSGKSTFEIQQIVKDIHAEMLEDRLLQLPDIEILPNIIGEKAKPKSKPRAVKAKASGSHRRVQSMGNYSEGESRDVSHSTRRSSYADRGYRQEYDDHQPRHKRQRLVNNGDDDLDDVRDYEPRGASRMIGHTVPDVRPLPSMAQPSNGNGHFHFNEARSTSNIPYDYRAPTGPLPIPRPNNYPEVGSGGGYEGYDAHQSRAFHQRAHSEAGHFALSTMPYGAGPSAGYGYPYGYVPLHHASQNYNAGPSYNPGPAYSRDYMRQEPSYPSNTAVTGYEAFVPRQQPAYLQAPAHYYQPAGAPQGGHPGGAAKHMRHQSTPVTPVTPRPAGPGLAPNLMPSDSYARSTADPYGQPSRHHSYGGLPSNTPRGGSGGADNMPRVAEEHSSQGSREYQPPAPHGEF